MNRGKCAKCGSTDVRRGPPLKWWRSSSGMIPVGVGHGSHVSVQWCVCVSCGYAETYVVKPEDREKIRKKWKLAIEREA